MLDLAAGRPGWHWAAPCCSASSRSLIYDERGVAPAAFARDGLGIAAIDGDDALMLAGGTAVGGGLWASRAPGHWTFDRTPLDPLQEGGYTDVFVGHGRALACGFDDGADTLQVVVLLDPATAPGTRSRWAPGSRR